MKRTPKRTIAPTLEETVLEETVARVDRLLATRGLHAVLGFLNSRTSHRFTAVYGLEEAVLRSLRLFDRENPELQAGTDTPLRETYCSLVGAEATPFATEDAREDERLHDHPARESALAYAGVPLVDEAGHPVATLCHFDIAPRPVPAAEVALMEAVGPLIIAHLREHGELPAPD